MGTTIHTLPTEIVSQIFRYFTAPRDITAGHPINLLFDAKFGDPPDDLKTLNAICLTCKRFYSIALEYQQSFAFLAIQDIIGDAVYGAPTPTTRFLRETKLLDLNETQMRDIFIEFRGRHPVSPARYLSLSVSFRLPTLASANDQSGCKGSVVMLRTGVPAEILPIAVFQNVILLQLLLVGMPRTRFAWTLGGVFTVLPQIQDLQLVFDTHSFHIAEDYEHRMLGRDEYPTDRYVPMLPEGTQPSLRTLRLSGNLYPPNNSDETYCSGNLMYNFHSREADEGVWYALGCFKPLFANVEHLDIGWRGSENNLSLESLSSIGRRGDAFLALPSLQSLHARVLIDDGGYGLYGKVREQDMRRVQNLHFSGWEFEKLGRSNQSSYEYSDWTTHWFSGAHTITFEFVDFPRKENLRGAYSTWHRNLDNHLDGYMRREEMALKTMIWIFPDPNSQPTVSREIIFKISRVAQDTMKRDSSPMDSDVELELPPWRLVVEPNFPDLEKLLFR